MPGKLGLRFSAFSFLLRRVARGPTLCVYGQGFYFTLH